jgi:hypothetical protein
VSSLADLLVHIGIDASDLSSGLDSVSSSIDENIGKITAFGAAGGAALEGFARSQAPLRESAQRLSASLGENAEDMRTLALEASNVTFPLDEVYASMESGRQQGLRSGEQIQEFARLWDMVGDATGESGPALADAGVALRAVGIAAGEESEALAAFGYITENTTGTVGEFLQFLEKTGPNLRDMGADVNDAAAVLGILENEFGMTGRTARSEFNKAIADSDGTLEDVLKTLGVSEKQFAAYGAQVEESSGIIARNAEIHADSYTQMQKAQHWAQELMHAHSGLFDVASALAMPMLMLGPAAKGVSMGFSLITGGIPKLVTGIGTAVTAIGTKVAAMASWAAATAAQGAAAVASLARTAAQFVAHYTRMAAAALAQAARMALSWIIAMGPIALVIAAVVGLVTLIVKNWDTIVSATKAAWDWIGEKVAAVWRWLKEKTSEAVAAIIGKFRSLVEWMRGVPGRIVSALGNVGSLLTKAGREILQSLWNGLKDKWEDVKSWVGGLGERIKDLKGPIQTDRKLLVNEGAAIMAGLGAGLSAGWGENEKLLSAMSGSIGDAFTGVAPNVAGQKVPSVGMAGETVLPTFRNHLRGGTGTVTVVMPVYLDGREIGRSSALIDSLSGEVLRRSRLTAGAGL